MRGFAAIFVSSILTAGLLCAQKAPDKLVFDAKPGKVLFDHTKHSDREKKKCESCHPKLWPQDAKAPLGFKAAMHKTAEAKKLSCAAAGCHVAGGTAFASVGNCKKCHGTATAPAKAKAD